VGGIYHDASPPVPVNLGCTSRKHFTERAGKSSPVYGNVFNGKYKVLSIVASEGKPTGVYGKKYRKGIGKLCPCSMHHSQNRGFYVTCNTDKALNGILTWQRWHVDHEGRPSRARVGHCTPGQLDLCDYPKCG